MRMSTGRVRKKARIEIIPLIDIIFFLLATFILVSMAMVKNLGMLVQLPGAATATKMETVNVAVSVNAEGQIYFNKEAVDLAGLEERGIQAKRSRFDRIRPRSKPSVFRLARCTRASLPQWQA